jgi:hypothetical protein
MGLFDGLTGSRTADAGASPVPAAELKAALLALNSDNRPWRVAETTKRDDQLFATWKFDEPRWQKLLTDTYMTRRIKILMEFREDRHEVRSVDEEFSVDAGAGIRSGWLGAFFSFSYGRGQAPQSGSQWTFGKKPDGHFGLLEHERLSSEQVKDALRQVVTSHGWAWHETLT